MCVVRTRACHTSYSSRVAPNFRSDLTWMRFMCVVQSGERYTNGMHLLQLLVDGMRSRFVLIAASIFRALAVLCLSWLYARVWNATLHRVDCPELQLNHEFSAVFEYRDLR